MIDDPRVTNSGLRQIIIQMAHSLDLTSIAEGVETVEQLEYLRHHGCDEMQGYLFSRPLPLKEVEEPLLYEPSAPQRDRHVPAENDSLAMVRSVAKRLDHSGHDGQL
jgi:predicted signal transduction protein with EAL and GGDEF domain